MPRYFFHLVGRTKIEDDEGEEFATEQEAEEHARQVASELAQNNPAMWGKSLVVFDADGRELIDIPLFEFAAR
jgi:hypothetical protein